MLYDKKKEKKRNKNKIKIKTDTAVACANKYLIRDSELLSYISFRLFDAWHKPTLPISHLGPTKQQSQHAHFIFIIENLAKILHSDLY